MSRECHAPSVTEVPLEARPQNRTEQNSKDTPKPPQNFDLTGPGLMRAFEFYYRGGSRLKVEGLAQTFGEMIRVGHNPQRMLDDITGKDRDRSETFGEWRFRYTKANPLPSKELGEDSAEEVRRRIDEQVRSRRSRRAPSSNGDAVPLVAPDAQEPGETGAPRRDSS